MALPVGTRTDQLAARMEQLAARVKSAGDRRNSIQVQLESARQQLAEAEREAIELSDCKSSALADLRNEISTKEELNLQTIQDLQTAIDDYEKYLTSIEKALVDPESMTALLLQLEGNKLTLPDSKQDATAAAPASAPALVFDDEI